MTKLFNKMEDILWSSKTTSCEIREDFLIYCNNTSAAVLQSSEDEKSKFISLKRVRKRTEGSGIYSFDNRKFTPFSFFKYTIFAVLLLSLHIPEGWSKSIDSAKKNTTSNGVSKQPVNPSAASEYNKAPITAQLILEDDEMHETETKMRGPIVQAVRGKYKCKKAYRKGRYCMHGGTCEWIPEINQPRCRCVSGWKGKRCREPVPDFTGKKNFTTVLVTTLILSIFGAIALILVGCICWRRVRYLRKHANDGEVNKTMLKSDENENNKSDMEIQR